MRPRLIHPQECVIQHIDRDATTFDPVFKSTAEVKYLPACHVQAQVSWNQSNSVDATVAGAAVMAVAKLTMLPAGYEGIGGLALGDKLIEVGGIPVEAYVSEVRPAAPNAKGRAGLIEALFASRPLGVR